MGFFSNSTPFDGDVEKITDEKNTSEDWGMIMDFCDRVQSATNGPRDCFKSISKRLNHQDPHVVMQAITLLDACVNNCGRPFRLEVASREFENEYKKLLARSHQKVKEKLKSMLMKWAEGDFKGDPQLALIPGLYHSLRKEIDFSSTSEQPRTIPKDPNVVSSQQEEDDIAKAIQLSLQDNNNKSSPSQKTRKSDKSPATTHHLYPSADTSASSSIPEKEQKKARALYDFEAAEDNELTFKAGEIVIVSDDSDANWWKGSNHRGEGLFPANFVTTDLDAEPEQFKEEKKRKSRRRSVQFNEEVEVKTAEKEATQPIYVNEEAIDRVMAMLNEADPTQPESDPVDLKLHEEHVNAMGPLIDAELEKIDRRHAQLTRISTELVDALNLYHQLMHEIPPMGGGYVAAPPVYNMPATGQASASSSVMMYPQYGQQQPSVNYPYPTAHLQGHPPIQMGAADPTIQGAIYPPAPMGSAPQPDSPQQNFAQQPVMQQQQMAAQDGGMSYRMNGPPPPVAPIPTGYPQHHVPQMN